MRLRVGEGEQLGEAKGGGLAMFLSTTVGNLVDAEKFARAYTRPVHEAFRSLGLSEDEADDQTQELLIKLMRRDLVADRDVLRGRFRDWLFTCVRNQAVSAFRRRKREVPNDFEILVPIDPSRPVEDRPDDVDLHFAVSIFNLTLREVRRHWEDQGRPEVWRVFDELVLAPLVPGRRAMSRDELRAAYPGRVKNFLDNCCTSVKRTIWRALPAMIPPELTDRRAPEERFAEWLTILRESGAGLSGRLHHAFETGPPCDPSLTVDASVAFAPGGWSDDSVEDPELREAEHRVVLGIWLAMPLRWYLDGAVVDAAFGPPTEDAPGAPSILGLASSGGGNGGAPERLRPVLEALKTFAKRVHHAVRPGPAEVGDDPIDRARRAHSMTPEVAQALYNLAWALALVRCGERIVSLEPSQLRKNLDWLLGQPWLDDRVKPTLLEARERLAGRPG